MYPSHKLFQSTLPRGSDYISVFSQVFFILISIHAPSRERLEFSAARLFYEISIHAPSRERHFDRPAPSSSLRYFNPRSLAGATVICTALSGVLFDFNPRSLAGATTVFLHRFSRLKISIHAPSRERRWSDTPTVAAVIFQSTLPRGSDKMMLKVQY